MKLQSLLCAAAPILGAITLAACGTSPSSSSASTTHESVVTATDKALGLTSLLKLSDFPAGWTSQGQITRGTGSTSGFSGSHPGLLASCLGIGRTRVDTSAPRWTSPTFSDSSSAVSVNDETTVFPTLGGATASYSEFSNSKTPSCLVTLLGGPLKQQLSPRLQPGETVGAVAATTRSLPPAGARSGDIELVVPITQAARQISVYVDVIVVLQGRAESVITTSSPITPFPTALGGQLAQDVASRMSG